jgi:hypothetical protein
MLFLFFSKYTGSLQELRHVSKRDLSSRLFSKLLVPEKVFYLYDGEGI